MQYVLFLFSIVRLERKGKKENAGKVFHSQILGMRISVGETAKENGLPPIFSPHTSNLMKALLTCSSYLLKEVGTCCVVQRDLLSC